MKLLGSRVASVVSLAALASGALTACSSSDESAPPCENVAPADKEACLSDHYFQGYAPSSLAACAGITASAQKIGARREVAFFYAPGISDGDIVLEGRYLQRFYASYDLTFFTRGPSVPTTFSYAMNGTNEQFLEAERRLGIDPQGELTPAQSAALDAAVADIMFGELRSFVKAQSNPPKSLVNVVVLPAIASPDVARQLQDTGVIAGLGISPTLFQNIADDDDSKNLFDLLALPADFTPTLFIGHDDIVALAQNPDEIVAHEMGHALGLEHTTQPGDLMTPYQADQKCRPVLTDTEVEQLRSAATQLLARSAALHTREGWRALVDARNQVVASLRQRRVN